MLVAACIPLLLWHPSKAAVDIGLYPTAVPDSFELRMATDGEDLTSVLSNLVVSVRWDASAGGTITGQDVRSDCGAYGFMPSGLGVRIVGPYAYYTFMVLSIRPLEDDCPITNTLEPIGGFRIRDLSGCRRVELVNDPLATVSNTSYYISIGGADVTGSILTGPLTSGIVPTVRACATRPRNSARDQLWWSHRVARIGHGDGCLAGVEPDPAHVPLFLFPPGYGTRRFPSNQTSVYFAVWNHCSMDSVTVPIERIPGDCSGSAGHRQYEQPVGVRVQHARPERRGEPLRDLHLSVDGARPDQRHHPPCDLGRGYTRHVRFHCGE
jgi:hypothetical protein